MYNNVASIQDMHGTSLVFSLSLSCLSRSIKHVEANAVREFEALKMPFVCFRVYVCVRNVRFSRRRLEKFIRIDRTNLLAVERKKEQERGERVRCRCRELSRRYHLELPYNSIECTFVAVSVYCKRSNCRIWITDTYTYV